MAIRLIALDLDGTLLSSDKRVTEKSKTVLQQAAAQGVAVCYATGRAICEMRDIIRELPGVRYAIVGNGASVLDLYTHERLAHLPLPAKTVREIARRLAPFDPMIEIFDGEELLSDEMCLNRIGQFDTADMLKIILNTRTPVNMARVLASREEPIAKVHVLFHDPATRDRAMQCVSDMPLYITHQLSSNLEFTSPQANKGAGLSLLARRLNIAPDEIMAVGDNLNDLPMFEVVGVPVAMGNALSEVRRAARFVTTNNDMDGAARAISQWALHAPVRC